MVETDSSVSVNIKNLDGSLQENELPSGSIGREKSFVYTDNSGVRKADCQNTHTCYFLLPKNTKDILGGTEMRF